MNFIYGVDTNKEITPKMIRDAIIDCFNEAHCKDSGIDSEDKNITKDYCRYLVKKAFSETGGDFYNPSKSDLLKVMDNLSEFSKNFRNPEIIKKHYQEIQSLLNKI